MEREKTPAERLKALRDENLRSASEELEKILDHYGVRLEVEMTVTQTGSRPSVKLVSNI